MATLPPTVVTIAGPQPLDPATIRAGIVSDVSSTNPGYTANLPGSLVEDVVSTDVAAVAQCDSARVETMNSVTPYGANAFALNQLGQMLGIPPGIASNTSVGLVFSGQPGYAIPTGFVVSDGTYQYVVQPPGGVVQASGLTLPITAVSPTPGSWAVPANTVTQLATSVPVGVSLTVTNPEAGTPGGAAETEWGYRARVLQANLAPAVGTGRALKTALMAVPGTVARLVSFQPSVSDPDSYEVIVGGGDDYAVANAILTSMFDYLDLVGSTMAVTAITRATTAQVTTLLKHGYVIGEVVTINGIVGMTPLNGIPVTVQAVVDLYNFTIGVNTSAYPAYVSGGVVTPNPRNFMVPISDYPDTYVVTFVRPPQQAVVIVATWNTTLINFTGAGAVAQLAAPALVDYVNSVAVGAPILVNAMEQVFAAAVANVLPVQYLTRLVFAVSIDGFGVSPVAGTFEINGDPESFFFAAATAVSVVQG